VSFVLDGSATMAWCFEDERTADTDQLLHELMVNGAETPALWPTEVVNATLTGLKKRRVDGQGAEEFLRKLALAPIFVHGPLPGWTDLLRFAQQHGLTGYDAAYLHLAIERNLPLATLDEEMKNAARRAGVSLLL
jgi:predicted nucleic acid-binding protein